MKNFEQMANAVAIVAAQLHDVHDSTHLIAAAATMTNEPELMREMMGLCETFHALDAALKASHDRLMAKASAGGADVLTVDELNRMFDPSNEAH